MDFANSVAPATAFEIQSSQLAQKENAKSAGDFKVAPKKSMGVKHLANYELERAPALTLGGDVSSRCSSPGSSCPQPPEQAAGWIPGTKPGMTTLARPLVDAGVLILAAMAFAGYAGGSGWSMPAGAAAMTVGGWWRKVRLLRQHPQVRSAPR